MSITIWQTQRSMPARLYHILLIAGLLYLVFVWRSQVEVEGTRFFSLWDDGMISMRFARNLAEGNGLVWNPGEKPIEGYSNFLWVVIMSLFHLAPFPEPQISLAVMVLCILILVANALLLRSFVQSAFPEQTYAANLACVLILFHYPTVLYTLRGMEVGFLSLLLSLLIFLLAGMRPQSPSRVWGFTITLAFAVLTRDDAAIFCIAASTLFLLQSPSWKNTFIVIFGGLLFPKLAQFGFRWLYYGDLLPNTYYVKVFGVDFMVRVKRGLFYLNETLFSHAFPLLFLAIHHLRTMDRTKETGMLVVLWALFLLPCGYTVFVGGDAWERMGLANRYICQGMGPLIVLAALSAETLLKSECLGRIMAAVALMNVFACPLWLSAIDLLSRPSQNPQIFIYSWGKLLYGSVLLLGSIFLFWSFGKIISSQRMLASSMNQYLISLRWRRLLPVVLVLLSSGLGWAEWLRIGSFDHNDAIGQIRMAVALRKAADPSARIAVYGAGNIPYFSHLPSIDLLGKIDVRIARMRPVRTEFMPGHTKWDYSYSIGELKPDVVCELWEAEGKDLEMLQATGYEELKNGVFVLKTSDKIDRALFERLFQGKSKNL